ncbi:hypothetical protein N658DRAFT_219567 [Parathielavia hyrcaniae]|uniref:Uncharacterized protein n=1 Tax=Parathielavia hyrcaniae TaxID=113614 RepID=A0AAN6PUZ7_9PEZI|nr:hypothetical protein N658DRAFT_219567 [Parathielavia hyrcaniae]
MFDGSFDLSRSYFTALQTLRLAFYMVNDTLQHWSDLRNRWDAVVKPSGMFSAEDLAASSCNWDLVTQELEKKAQRVQDEIARKSEEVKALRDGLFNATSLRESTKGITLNRAVYVSTVVIVLYTPLGFLAPSSSSDETGAKPTELPHGFTTTFIAVPLATYSLCIAVVRILGPNGRERRGIQNALGFIPEVVQLLWQQWITRRRAVTRHRYKCPRVGLQCRTVSNTGLYLVIFTLRSSTPSFCCL